MEFLNLKQLELNPANYLISKESGKPVNHAGFVAQQKQAEYIIKLSEAIKGKTFSVNKVDDLAAIKQSVRNAINSTEKSYVETPVKPTSSVNEELIKFALDFNDYENVKIKTQKINEFMNQFNSINDVETVGEYFEEKVIKLNAIYTIAQILEAVKTNVDLLGNI